MNVSSIVEKRLLAAVEQSARAGLPAAWQHLAPRDDDPAKQKKQRRPASRVLLEVAELTSRQEMTVRLRDIAARTRRNREDRDEGESDLWEQIADLVEGLGATDAEWDADQGAAARVGLSDLSLWSGWSSWSDPASPLRELARPPFELPPVREELLTALARVLLRELARRWSAAARDEERATSARSTELGASER